MELMVLRLLVFLVMYLKQTRDIVKDATGVDMADIMKANTIDAKVNKNVNVNGDVENTNVLSITEGGNILSLFF